MTLYDRLRWRIGRRGLVLILLSTVYFLLGLKAFIDPTVDAGRFLIYTDIPFWIRGIMWTGSALLGIFAATFRRGHNDAIGFAALCVPSSIVAVSWLTSYLGYLFGLTSHNTGWVDALEWVSILALLIVTSGWQEVDRDVEIVSLVDKKED